MVTTYNVQMSAIPKSINLIFLLLYTKCAAVLVSVGKVTQFGEDRCTKF